MPGGDTAVEFAQGARLTGAEYLATVAHFREEIAQHDALSDAPEAGPEHVDAREASREAGSDDD